jgi:metallo-beta-lactamase class B
MKSLVAVLLVVACSSVLAQNKKYSIDVQRIDTNVFVYHSYGDYCGETIPANGLIIASKDSVIVLDTPWDLTQTIQLINWIMANLKKPIALVIVTHAHADRIGGISVLLNDKFPVYGSVLTAQAAFKNGFRQPDHQFVNDTIFCCDGIYLETFYPGEGHTSDNIVVYLPNKDILFGGCFLKNAHSTSLGNLEDANVPAWAQSITRLKERYSHPKIVVPGHGGWEGGAIDTTEKLVQDAVKKRSEK